MCVSRQGRLQGAVSCRRAGVDARGDATARARGRERRRGGRAGRAAAPPGRAAARSPVAGGGPRGGRRVRPADGDVARVGSLCEGKTERNLISLFRSSIFLHPQQNRAGRHVAQPHSPARTSTDHVTHRDNPLPRSATRANTAPPRVVTGFSRAPPARLPAPRCSSSQRLNSVYPHWSTAVQVASSTPQSSAAMCMSIRDPEALSSPGRR